MKKLIALIILIATINLAQSWNSIKTSNISVSSSDNVEMFTNSFGNNIIKESSGVLTYYAMNVSGTAGSSVTIESSGVSNANITGDDHLVYVVYEKGSEIKAKYSTNSGSNWNAIDDLDINPVSLDAVYFDGLLHITYSESNAAKYYQFDGDDWVEPYTVSSTETGTNPRIEVYEEDNYVYVAYDNGNNCKSREYNVGGDSWDSIETLYSNISNAWLVGFGVDDNYIYLYYSQWAIDPIHGSGYSLFENKILKSNYSTASSLRYFRTEVNFTNSTTTYDENVHTAFQWVDALGKYKSPDAGVNIATFDDGTKSFETVYATYDVLYHVDISSTYNDLHVIWKIPSSSYLRYRQYDTTPSTPQNLIVTSYNSHPKLTWAKSVDADFDFYRIYKKKGSGSYSVCCTTTTNEYVDDDETMITGPLQAHETTAKYKITIVDLGDLESDYSNEVEARVEGEAPEKIVAFNASAKVENYDLKQNYPNPFNPATQITYQIKELGFVQLEVYDVLGKNVATLVNQVQGQGSYIVNFDASNLVAGIYIYSLKVNEFAQSRKMLLIK